MAVRIAQASISENGTIRGKAGNQNGRELNIRNWYRHSKGWYTLRAIDPEMREYIARAAEKAVANPQIGYDQTENRTLWNNVATHKYDPSKTTKPVETDCAELAALCAQHGLAMTSKKEIVADSYTANLAANLVKTGWFERLAEGKYTASADYLLRGDILVTRTKGHAIIILDNGSKEEAYPVPDKAYDLGERILKNGMSGADVKELQEYLIQLGFSCGSYGADGDFGDATEAAVEAFQAAHDCKIDGEAGPETLAALMKELADKEIDARFVRIVGGNCYVRAAPNTSGNKLGVAYEGDKLEYQGLTSEAGWNLVAYKGQNGWVSGKYSKLTEG